MASVSLQPGGGAIVNGKTLSREQYQQYKNGSSKTRAAILGQAVKTSSSSKKSSSTVSGGGTVRLDVAKVGDLKRISSNGTRSYYTTADIAARDKAAGVKAPSSSATTTQTSVGQETAAQTAARAKALLGDKFDPSTPAPSQARLDEIANQSFIDPNVRQAFQSTRLPQASVPSNVGAIASPFQEFVAPQTTPGFGDISSSLAGTAGLGALNQSNQQFFQQQLAQQQQQFESEKSGLKDFFNSLTSQQEARAQAEDRVGLDAQAHFASVDASIKEIESLTNDYNRAVEAKDQQIAATHDKLASNNFINNQIAQIERNAAPKLNRISAEINAKAAVLQAQEGNFAEAQKYVNQAVADATADNKFKADMFNAAFELNRENFDRIQSIYANAYETSMGLAQAAYEEQRVEKEQIGELLLSYPNAGIDIYNDSLEDAFRKAGIAPRALGTGGTGTGGGGLSLSSRTNQVIDGFISLSELTPTERAKVNDDLFSLGYNSENPPQWFIDGLQEERQQSLRPEVVREEWLAHRDTVIKSTEQVSSTGINYDEL